MFYFTFARVVFLTYNYLISSNLQLPEIFNSFLHGLRLDASITGYLLIIPTIYLIFSPILNKKTVGILFNIYNIIIIIICTLIITADIELYRNWGFRIDGSVLFYISQPKEALASTDFSVSVLLFLIFLFQIFLFFFLYEKFVGKQIQKFTKNNYKTSLVFILILGSLFLPIRGSVGIAPINTGTVYFSEKNVFANHAAVNPIWNFVFSLTEADELEKISFFEDKKAEKLFLKLTKNKNNTTRKVLNTSRPNVIIVILESFTAKIIGSLGGKKGITPNLDKIAENGILFSNLYATGDRTDKGIIAVLSGYPAQPTSSIMKFSKKTEKLPKLPEILKNNGYNTEWICGFNIDFANMRSYIYSSDYDKITDIEDFPKNKQGEKWGVHDHFVFEKLSESIENTKEPFFKVFMTLSSHEPFDVPMKPVFSIKNETDRFLNSAYYTDKSLGKFIEDFKKTKKWKNTLIIFVADHGSRLPDNTAYHLPLKFRIPMIWTGGAVSKHDTIIQKTASQIDIPKTVLSQLNIENKDFKFSKNIFSDKVKSYAFYSYNNGFGLITDSTTQVFDNELKKYVLKKGKITKKNQDFGKAYQQTLMENFVEL